MPAPLPLYQVDAFADGPFTGNPAAVCVLEPDDPRRDDARWMLRVAEEMNLSETAFVHRVGHGDGTPGSPWSLRWFTPAAEVELCGHATLAAAHTLWETRRVDPDAPLVFHTRFRGELACRREPPGAPPGGLSPDRIAMDFPADAFDESLQPPPALFDALGLARDRVVAAARGAYDWLIEVDAPGAVVGLAPDFVALARFDTRGVAVTAWARDLPVPRPAAPPVTGVDIVSRFFAPRLRVHEDPVTGSLHCLFGPWYRHRRGADTLHAYQASTRGGRVHVTTRDDRIQLAGHALTLSRGELLH